MPDLRSPLQLRPFALHDVRVVEGWLCGNGLSLPAGLLRHEWPQRLLADPRITALIATVAGREVGFVRLDCGPDQVAELTLVVDPDCRRQGHGTEMFAHVMRLVRSISIRRLFVSIDLHNEPAIEFFVAQGFVDEGLVAGRRRMGRLVHAGDHQPPLEIEA
ncbi:MAG TPA: GNAT family N-acetyltransferase [Planctomycetota bacterium]